MRTQRAQRTAEVAERKAAVWVSASSAVLSGLCVLKPRCERPLRAAPSPSQFDSPTKKPRGCGAFDESLRIAEDQKAKFRPRLNWWILASTGTPATSTLLL